jgi:hypothetical protein
MSSYIEKLKTDTNTNTNTKEKSTIKSPNESKVDPNDPNKFKVDPNDPNKFKVDPKVESPKGGEGGMPPEMFSRWNRDKKYYIELYGEDNYNFVFKFPNYDYEYFDKLDLEYEENDEE